MKRLLLLTLIISNHGFSFTRSDIKFNDSTNFKGVVVNIFKLEDESNNLQEIIFSLEKSKKTAPCDGLGPHVSLVDTNNYEVTKTRLDMPTEVGQKKLTNLMVLDQKNYKKPFKVKIFCDN